MLQRLTQLTNNKLAESSTLVQSKYVCGQTQNSLMTNHSNASQVSMQKLVIDLKKTIQEQQKKIFDFELTLRKHHFDVIELEKALEVQRQYSQQLKNQIQAYRQKQLSQYSSSSIRRLEEQNLKLQKQIELLKVFQQHTPQRNRSCNESRCSTQSFQGKIDQLQQMEVQLKKIRDEMVVKEEEMKQKFANKEEKLKKKLKIMLKVLSRFQILFQKSQNIQSQLIQQINFLRANLS